MKKLVNLVTLVIIRVRIKVLDIDFAIVRMVAKGDDTSV